MDNEVIREQIKKYFEKNAIKKSALASFLNISPQCLTEWLHNRSNFDNLRLSMIEKFMENQWLK